MDTLDKLPRVDIIYAHANMSAELIDAAVRNGAKGLVIAGVGNGNATTPALDALSRATKSGVVVVRSTRLPSGIVLRNNEDGFRTAFDYASTDDLQVGMSFGIGQRDTPLKLLATPWGRASPRRVPLTT